MALGKKRTPAGKRAEELIRRLDGLRKDATRPVCFRLDPREYDKIVSVAASRGLKPAQLLKSWTIERMKSEGI